MILLYHQKPGQSNEDYKEAFEALWSTFETQGGCIWRHLGLILIGDRAVEIAEENGRAQDANGVFIPNDDDTAEAEPWVEERIKASMMLSAADNKRQGDLKKYLENRYAVDHSDEFPSNTTRLLSQMNNFHSGTGHNIPNIRGWLARQGNQGGGGGNNEDGVAFVQQGEAEETPQESQQEQQGVNMFQRHGGMRPSSKGTKKSYASAVSKGRGTGGQAQTKQPPPVDQAKIKAKEAKQCNPQEKKEKCLHCGGTHSLADCSDLRDEQLGQLMIQLTELDAKDAKAASNNRHGGMLQQGEGIGSLLNPNWVYVDTCTTDDQMINPAYLSNVHEVENRLHLQTNARSASTNLKGYLGNTLFWLDQMGIANVVSLRTLESKYKVTYDSERDSGEFVVHTPDGRVLIKGCPKTSFPYIDLTDESGGATIMMVQTVRERFEGYTKQEVERAMLAWKLQGRIGNPSKAQFKRQVSRRPIRNPLFSNCKIKLPTSTVHTKYLAHLSNS